MDNDGVVRVVRNEREPTHLLYFSIQLEVEVDQLSRVAMRQGFLLR